jgi:hypothetical protein
MDFMRATGGVGYFALSQHDQQHFSNVADYYLKFPPPSPSLLQKQHKNYQKDVKINPKNAITNSDDQNSTETDTDSYDESKTMRKSLITPIGTGALSAGVIYPLKRRRRRHRRKHARKTVKTRKRGKKRGYRRRRTIKGRYRKKGQRRRQGRRRKLKRLTENF